ncbi:hypothetical protein [Caulobacter sp. 1776]|uniref:hypothetical protein n=1 Tax=Caulobacter sp. 1776 TaxID=3156420 RepID=UPI0033918585
MLPEDDDPGAFIMKERICRDEMNRILANYGQNDDDSEVWMEYVVQIRAAAAAYEIDNSLLAMPQKLDRDSFWKFYEGAVTTSAMLSRGSRRARIENTVSLTEAEKARLEKKLAELRAAVDAAPLSEKIKAGLRKRLEGFEEELKKERSSLARILVTTSLVFSAVSGATIGALSVAEKAEDVIGKLPATIDAILKITGKAKAEEVERQSEQKALPAPPRALPGIDRTQVAVGYGEHESFSADLDDEIPF